MASATQWCCWAPMPIPHRVFRAINCKRCSTRFYICQSCYRGHRYCGDECRGQARAQQMREANRRYRCSQEARLDHRDRQRRYRRSENSVLYQSSNSDQSDAMIASPAPQILAVPVSATGAANLKRPFRGSSARLASRGEIQCQVCGRYGEYIDISTGY